MPDVALMLAMGLNVNSYGVSLGWAMSLMDLVQVLARKKQSALILM
jgi:hypothetical protein